MKSVQKENVLQIESNLFCSMKLYRVSFDRKTYLISKSKLFSSEKKKNLIYPDHLPKISRNYQKWNVTPLFFEGGGRYSFAAYFAPNTAFTLLLIELHFCLFASLSLPGRQKGQQLNKKEGKSCTAGANYISQQNFIAPTLDLMPLLPPSFVGRASRALNPRQEQ